MINIENNNKKVNYIGLRIKEIREQLNLSQNRFGYKLGISGKTISAYENGRALPPLLVLEKLTKVFGINLVSIEGNKKGELSDRLRDIESKISEIREIIDAGITI